MFGETLEGAEIKFRIWKLLEKRMCKLPSLWTKVCKKDFQLSMRSSRHSCEKSPMQSVPPVFALRLYVGEHLGHHQNSSSAQMLGISLPSWGQLCAQSRN